MRPVMLQLLAVSASLLHYKINVAKLPTVIYYEEIWKLQKEI